MKVLKQQAYIVEGPTQADAFRIIWGAAKECYRSKTVKEPKDFVTMLYTKGHLSPFEHVNVVTRLVTDIATYKALTRHRHCSFTIESTHFIGYEELEIIEIPELQDDVVMNAFIAIEHQYQEVFKKYGKLISRQLIPQAQAAVVTMTTNLREWEHIFKLRKGPENTPNMSRLIGLIIEKFEAWYPDYMNLISYV